MKTKAREKGEIIPNKPHDAAETENKDDKQNWFLGLVIEDIVDKLPIMTHAKEQKERIQIPVHPSTDLIVTMIREKYPEKFRINLDVYKSMVYAGRQLFEYVFLQHVGDVKKSKRYKMAKAADEVDSISYDINWLNNYLDKLMEGYLSQGQGDFGRDKILGKIEDIKELIPEDLHCRCDNFIDEELDSELTKARIRERLRKREYRERTKNIKLVKM